MGETTAMGGTDGAMERAGGDDAAEEAQGARHIFASN